MNNVARFVFIFIPKDFMVFTYPCFDTAVDFGVIITCLPTMDWESLMIDWGNLTNHCVGNGVMAVIRN